MLHKQPMANWPDGRDDRKCATTAVSLLLTRITNFLQILFVTSDFPSFFSKKLMEFFQSLYFPINCRYFVNWLNIFLWDDPLLVAVLKGQNVSGTRIVKGKKKVLFECLNVIQARKKKLLEQHKYRELARYLKAVKSENTLHMQNLLDEIPFYMCKCGDFNSAAESLFSARYPFCCTACRLSPVQFIVYLKILLSGQVPAGNEVDDSGRWETIQGTAPLKKSFVVKIALQTLSCNNQLFTDPESWEALITATCSSHKLTKEGNFQCIAYKKPDEEFIQRHRYLSMKIVEELKMRQNFVYPQCFHDARYRDEALLLLVTEALMKMPYNDFPVLLNIVLAFRENMWALKYLLDGLNETLLNQFIYCLEMDLYRHSNILLTRLSPNDPQVLGDFIFFFLSQEHYLLWPIGNMIQDILLKNWTVHQNYYWQNHLHCKMNKENPSHISQ
ncbi:uncharacterized protein zgc:112980 [Erpetoichthys calabaricus]|uniref:uncharacterized protein zgc:112980 n=1 Tax=Erpetoichthys calabaricus TaxID=27687 RepID=UPI00223472F7|nr:uncharacterized protein zgc:112980 [Erpetoichthys calabaricus]